MANRVVIDSDYIIDTANKIKETSSEITNVLKDLKNTCEYLDSGISDPNTDKFKTKFNSFIDSISQLTNYYNSISSTIKSLVADYIEVDEQNASGFNYVVEEIYNGKN